MATFAERIKYLRKERGYSQAELADLIKVNKQTISGYERGVRRPDFETLDELADVLNVDISFLLGSSDMRGQYPRHEEQLPINGEEMRLLAAYRSASDDTRAAVRAVLQVK